MLIVNYFVGGQIMELYNQYKELNKYNSIIFNVLKYLGISYKTNGAIYIRIIVIS